MPGISTDCASAEVPRAVTLPPWMLGTATEKSRNIISGLPAMMSSTASAEPLYGTCCTLRPASFLNTSMKRWCGLPLPEVA